jgi:hypothetical protein
MHMMRWLKQKVGFVYRSLPVAPNRDYTPEKLDDLIAQPVLLDSGFA